MRKIWLIAGTTYRQQVRTGTFLVLTFGLPVLMVIAGAVGFFTAAANEERVPSMVGVVDETAQLDRIDQIVVDDIIVNIKPFMDQAAAQAALEAGEIGVYLVIPVGYFEGAQPELHTPGELSTRLNDALEQFLRRAVLPDAPEWLPERLANPVAVTFVDRASGAEITRGLELVVRIVTPFVLAGLFGLLVFTTAGQMGAAMVREKDQRAMEMVITSLTPRQLVVGKILGLTLLSLTQIGIWLLGAAVALALALSGTLDTQTITMPWRVVLWAVLLGLPAYFLYSVLAAGLGILAGDAQQARQLAGVLGFLGLVPLYLAGVMVSRSDSTLALILTLFPLTSPVISLIRMALGTIPDWQLWTALAIIVVSLLLSIWTVARVFRAAMLLYGQALRPREIWHALSR